ncbi:MAG TPA: HAMP domain-containing sensor histidine kinase [Candidatus Binataceae bacterium]|nr:HAMP domain-containing sensor histidine kinase [Candidatus Binataceae bacterium]
MPIKQNLEAELKARDEFFSLVAHELRNPLNALHLTLAGLLRAQNATTPLAPDQLASRINRASTQVSRLAKLVDDMLDVSRISAGRFNLQIEEFDAAATLNEAVGRLNDPENPPINLMTLPTLIVECDRTRFAQMASNLIANAIAYGDHKPVTVRLEAAGANFRLEVQDHGKGIAEADQERIFERFVKLEPENSGVRFGLGLWVAREVARALHGDLRVQSQIGAGSKFILELPRKSALASLGRAG